MTSNLYTWKLERIRNMNAMDRKQYSHFYPITVRWGEMDAFGHVNNTVFYRYSEDGRMDYLRRAFASVAEATEGAPIIADLRCNFRQQLKFPAEVEIATRTSRLGNTSFHMEQALYYKGEMDAIAAFEAVLVWFDYNRQSSAPLPESIRTLTREMEAVPPEE